MVHPLFLCDFANGGQGDHYAQGEGRGGGGVKPTKTNISASFENYMFVRENCVRDYIDIIDKQALMLSINGQNLLNITNIHALYSVGLEKKRIIFILN